MKTFAKNILLFLTPVILLFIPPSIILKTTGENFTSINSVLNSKNEYLIGYTYNENNTGYLKWYTINNQDRFNVMALGSSRVLQFRSNMFNEPFYNAGFTVSKISDFKLFLQSLPKEKHPDYLIIGLDQWMFNQNWDNGKNKKHKNHWKNSFSILPRGRTYLNVYKHLFEGKYGFDIIDNNSSVEKVGLNAMVNNKGFRNDGSGHYGNQITRLLEKNKSSDDRVFSDTFDRIKNGNRRFEYGETINQYAVNELKELLQYCNKSKIEVIGFCPPFANTVYHKMIKSEKYKYLKELPIHLSLIFKEYNFEFYNYSSNTDCNSSDKESIDGFHGSEVTYSRILIDMLSKNSTLNSVSDLSRIESDLSDRKNTFTVYD